MSRRPPRRYEIEQVLGRKIRDSLWKYLSDNGFVGESPEYSEPIQWLAKKAKELLEAAGEGPVDLLASEASNRRQRRVRAMPVKREAISSLLAAIARNDEMVKIFRKEYLKTGYLSPAQVPAWIYRRRDQGSYSRAMILSLPAGLSYKWSGEWHAKPPLSILKAGRMEGFLPNEFLAYAEPDSVWRRIIPVRRDGILRNLQQLSASLAEQFGWQEAQATIFILTDLVPLVGINTVQIKWPRALRTEVGSNEIFPVACLARITITVDPLMTPQEVAALYRKTRATHLRRKPRSLSDKHMLLAAYLADHSPLDGKLMAEWNRQHPKWQYRRFSLFSRDARRARHVILHDLILDYSKTMAV